MDVTFERTAIRMSDSKQITIQGTQARTGFPHVMNLYCRWAYEARLNPAIPPRIPPTSVIVLTTLGLKPASSSNTSFRVGEKTVARTAAFDSFKPRVNFRRSSLWRYN